jgi:hypothetical protein
MTAAHAGCCHKAAGHRRMLAELVQWRLCAVHGFAQERPNIARAASSWSRPGLVGRDGWAARHTTLLY